LAVGQSSGFGQWSWINVDELWNQNANNLKLNPQPRLKTMNRSWQLVKAASLVNGHGLMFMSCGIKIPIT
jgi:hypothetical protein